MNEILEILKYTIPAITVLAAVWFLTKKFVDYNSKHLVVMQQSYELEKQKLESESKRKREELFIPLKLQAYERLSLFLERINPPNLIPRELKPGMKAGELNAQLLTAVKDEFEHNMSQQIYLSDEAWILVKNAKEEILSLINRSAAAVLATDTGIKLAEVILSHTFEEGKNPVDLALAALKNDIRTQFS